MSLSSCILQRSAAGVMQGMMFSPGSSHPFDLLRDIDSTPVLQSFEHINSLSLFQVDECTILPCNWYDLQANTHTDSLHVHSAGSHDRLAAKGKCHEHVCILSALQGQPDKQMKVGKIRD